MAADGGRKARVSLGFEAALREGRKQVEARWLERGGRTTAHAPCVIPHEVDDNQGRKGDRRGMRARKVGWMVLGWEEKEGAGPPGKKRKRPGGLWPVRGVRVSFLF
jgi:hypothetical protein